MPHIKYWVHTFKKAVLYSRRKVTNADAMDSCRNFTDCDSVTARRRLQRTCEQALVEETISNKSFVVVLLCSLPDSLSTLITAGSSNDALKSTFRSDIMTTNDITVRTLEIKVPFVSQQSSVYSDLKICGTVGMVIGTMIISRNSKTGNWFRR